CWNTHTVNLRSDTSPKKFTNQRSQSIFRKQSRGFMASATRKWMARKRIRFDSGFQASPFATDSFITYALEEGLPKDSIRRFGNAWYIPQPKQLAFHIAARSCDHPEGPTEIGFGGARAGAKTHAAFAQVAIDDCGRVPGLKFMMLRRIGKSNLENVDDF